MSHQPRTRFGALASLTLPALALAVLSGGAPANELFIGSRNTLVSKADPLGSSNVVVGACGGVVQSMTLSGSTTFIGDVSGNVYRFDASQSFLTYAFTAGNDARALESAAGVLLVGGSNGTIERRDPASGALLGTLQVGAPVLALHLDGGLLYVGSQFGALLSGDPATGGFQFFGTCGNNLTSLATDSGLLFAADEGGNLWSFDLATKFLLNSVPLAQPATSLVSFEGDLIAGSADGILRRYDRHSGALKQATAIGWPVDALALEPASAPGVAYCFGSGCPCGNDDPENACANSTGFGATIHALGSASVAADDLALVAFDLPHKGIARFYMGPQKLEVPFGAGKLCAGTGGYSTFRFPAGNTTTLGVLQLGPGIVDYAETHFGVPGLMAPGNTWHFQAWYRDPIGPCGETVNMTNAYSVTLAP